MLYSSTCPHCSSTFVRSFRSKYCSPTCAAYGRPKRPTVPVTERFWAYVDVSGGETKCWEWKGNISHYGYGRLNVKKKLIPAHRLSYEIHFGEIGEGLFVCHHCDNPPCVNPTHLFIGTHQDNMADKHKKKRELYGERHQNSKVTSNTVREIRRLFSEGLSQSQIRKQFGLKAVHVNKIVHRKLWKEVK